MPSIDIAEKLYIRSYVRGNRLHVLSRAPPGMGKGGGGSCPPPGNVQMGICNPSLEFLTVFVVGLSRISGVVRTYLRMKNVHDS